MKIDEHVLYLQYRHAQLQLPLKTMTTLSTLHGMSERTLLAFTNHFCHIKLIVSVFLNLPHAHCSVYDRESTIHT